MHFAKVSKKPEIPRTRAAKAKRRARRSRIRKYVAAAHKDPSPDARPMSIEEINLAIKRLKPRRAPGEDIIYNEFLIHSTEKIKQEFCELANSIWRDGEVPMPFKRSDLCPALKPNKPPEQTKSYRPLALTSCLGKLMERLVLTRLTFHLESHGKLQATQSAFRPGRATTDVLSRLIAEIQEGFEKKKPHIRTLMGKLDLSSAYNRVDHSHLIDIMADLGIPPCYGKFFHSFLQDRVFRVRCGGTYSKFSHERCGTPQGTVSSPVLFIIYMEAML